MAKLSLAILSTAALVSLAATTANAMPIAPQAAPTLGAQPIRWVCNEWGRCGWQPNYYRRYGYYRDRYDDDWRYRQRYREGYGYYGPRADDRGWRRGWDSDD